MFEPSFRKLSRPQMPASNFANHPNIGWVSQAFDNPRKIEWRKQEVELTRFCGAWIALTKCLGAWNACRIAVAYVVHFKPLGAHSGLEAPCPRLAWFEIAVEHGIFSADRTKLKLDREVGVGIFLELLH